MLQRLQRILRHRWLDDATTRRAIPPALADKLAQHVAESERRHTGEVRIYVEAGLPLGYLWRDAVPRERAIAMFGKLGVWDTEQNNGVLIYLLLAEHAIEVVADRGLSRHVRPEQWQEVVQHMRDAFRAGQYEQGLLRAVDEVTALLVQHFPAAPGAHNANELPDTPILG
ncbi:TPM domain-containing protein [Ramlibacter pallidus]|uniref:TPM domain-containing protein n=1 Tax=Ramlibacter pallidus TaxID=2780087 RepID=A0ABR9S1X8_9BURK|nr:TPM domain-containing protein [Ramlibacter pallidus]MBE7367052.1 TPM domain-containing protein [Ramlibacter pallidus]